MQLAFQRLSSGIAACKDASANPSFRQYAMASQMDSSKQFPDEQCVPIEQLLSWQPPSISPPTVGMVRAKFGTSKPIGRTLTPFLDMSDRSARRDRSQTMRLQPNFPNRTFLSIALFKLPIRMNSVRTSELLQDKQGTGQTD